LPLAAGLVDVTVDDEKGFYCPNSFQQVGTTAVAYAVFLGHAVAVAQRRAVDDEDVGVLGNEGPLPPQPFRVAVEGPVTEPRLPRRPPDLQALPLDAVVL
jgi:hypothetical protein